MRLLLGAVVIGELFRGFHQVNDFRLDEGTIGCKC